MARIDIHIDTETTETHLQSKALQPMTSNKAGLLSTITITDDQINAFDDVPADVEKGGAALLALSR
jgi:hypothetical protein